VFGFVGQMVFLCNVFSRDFEVLTGDPGGATPPASAVAERGLLRAE
jgi:hypothetical protein